MPREIACPPADAKVAKKIDYIVARWLAPPLQSLGFVRKGRSFIRPAVVEGRSVIAFVNVQSGQWNQGTEGGFFINLGVQFPEVVQLIAGIPSLSWKAAYADKADDASAVVSTRINELLTGPAQDWWPPGMESHFQSEIAIKANSDLDTLARPLARLLEENLGAWLDRYQKLGAVLNETSLSLLLPHGFLARLAAGILLQQPEAAARLFLEQRENLARTAEQFDELQAWSVQHGLAVQDARFEAAAPAPRSQERQQRWEKELAAEQDEITCFLADASPLAGRIESFLRVFLHEARSFEQAHGSEPGLDSYATIQGLAAETDDVQRQVILTALQLLPGKQEKLELRADNVWSGSEFTWDTHWGRLITWLLDRPLPATEVFCRGLLAAMQGLVHRHDHEKLTASLYRYPFARIVAYLDRQGKPWRQSLKFDVEALLQALRTHLVDSARQHEEDVRQRAAQPDAESIWIESAKLPSMAELHDRHPEFFFDTDDRAAVITLKRWLQRGANDELPLEIEDDDWGRQLKAALADTLPSLRAPLESLLAWFAANDPGSKPTRSWLKQLAEQVRPIDPPLLGGWLDSTLARFPESGLTHRWMVPGQGALPGVHSGPMLLGLIHLAGQLAQVSAVPVLARLAEAAFLVTTGGQVRAQKAGTAATAALACSAGGREELAAMKARNGKPLLLRAIESALAKGSP